MVMRQHPIPALTRRLDTGKGPSRPPCRRSMHDSAVRVMWRGKVAHPAPRAVPGGSRHATPRLHDPFHRPGPMKLTAISGDDPDDGSARGRVVNCKPSSATGLMSLRCSTGRFSLCARHVSVASSCSTLYRSACSSASAFSRAPCDSAALSSASLAISRSSAAIS
jgi:hypothetical protein